MAESLVYCYAVTDAAHDLGDLRGLDDAPVLVRFLGGVHAALSRHRDLVLGASTDQLLRCAAVTDSAMEHGSAVPLRFGTLMEEDQLAALLAQRAEELRADLHFVRGRVEVGLRVTSASTEDPATVGSPGRMPRGDPAPQPGDGREHMRRLQRRERESTSASELAADRCHERLAQHAPTHRLWRRPREGVLLTAAYLVERAQVDELAAVVDELERHETTVRLALTGPWAPYSFVGGIDR